MKKTLTELKNLLAHMEYYNRMAPFPPYDTDYVKDIKKRINKMEENNKINYDDEPVVACKFCKSLHIEIDDVENNVCMKCGSINELVEFENIDEYLKFKNDKDS